MSYSLDKAHLPFHVGIIMDGNGRWAKLKNQNRTFGHSEGLKRAKEITKYASDLGLKFLTLYVFSTENWKRTESEVSFLMNLIHIHLTQEFKFYKDNQIRVKIVGSRENLPKLIQEDIEKVEKETNHFTGLTICLAINYGGRNSIVNCIKKIVSQTNSSKISENDINESLVSEYIDFKDFPNADLIIRTGGEKRLSNFLMWQSAYSEFIFSDVLWPDYKIDNFEKDLIEFQNRTRKFGAV